MDHSPYYRNRPDADIAVLMIHGILGTPRHFDWLIPAIPDDITVSNILLPGHGGSVQDFSHATMEQWQTYVEKTVSDLEKSGRRIIVVGHSLGSLLALHAAVKHNSICALMLLNVPLCPQLRPRLMGRNLRAAFGKLNKNDPKDAQFSQACGTVTEPYLWKYLAWIPNFLSLLCLCRKSRSIPSRLCIPCCAYLGGEDDLVNIRTKKWLQNHPQITMRYFPNGTHFGYSEQERSIIKEDFDCMLQNISKKQAL